MSSPTPDVPKRYLVRANTGTDAAPVWTPCSHMTAYTPRQDVTKQDATTFDHGNYKGPQITTQLGWGGSGTFLRNRYAGVEDPGQKALRLAATPQSATAVPATQIGVQIIDRFGGDDCIQGFASITWEPQGGGQTDLQTVNFTLDGVGYAPVITNPLLSAIVPAIGNAAPSGAAAGAQVSIYGSGFTGATLVKFAAVTATQFTVISDGLIVAVMPAGTAGSAPITVTTPGGTSAAYGYTRGA